MEATDIISMLENSKTEKLRVLNIMYTNSALKISNGICHLIKQILQL